mmetsp:Transcript_1689/g.3594  ORF Transcript_1689/g.3594 Transcript_1689/m.3594 type:complete len:541 (+) Transcript_1689:33-1655(+)
MRSFTTPAILAVAVAYLATVALAAVDGEGAQTNFLSGSGSSRQRLLMHRKLLMNDDAADIDEIDDAGVNEEDSHIEPSLQERLLNNKKKKNKKKKIIQDKIKKANNNNKKKKMKNENKREKRNKKKDRNGWNNDSNGWNDWGGRGELDEWGNCNCDKGQWWGRTLFADEADEHSTQSRDDKAHAHDQEETTIPDDNEEQNQAATLAETFAAGNKEDIGSMASITKRNGSRGGKSSWCSCHVRRPATFKPTTARPTIIRRTPRPTRLPTPRTSKPSRSPTKPPTTRPTRDPSPVPTKEPSPAPSPSPSKPPTTRPTRNPASPSPPSPSPPTPPTPMPPTPPTPPTPPSPPSPPSPSPPNPGVPTPNPTPPVPTQKPTFLCLENRFCNGVDACLGVPDLNLINQDGACNGFEACRSVVNTIANCACTGRQACLNNSGNIGNNSWCVYGSKFFANFCLISTFVVLHFLSVAILWFIATVKKRAPLMRGSYDLRSQAIHVMDGNLAVDVQILLIIMYVTILLNAACLKIALVDATKILSQCPRE